MNKPLLFAIMIGLSLSGCSVPYHKAYLADGSQGFRVTCNGMFSTRHDCIKLIGDLCSSAGFEIINEAGEKSAIGMVAANQSQAGGFVGNVERRSMYAKCRTKNAKHAETINAWMNRRIDQRNTSVRALKVVLWAIPIIGVPTTVYYLYPYL